MLVLMTWHSGGSGDPGLYFFEGDDGSHSVDRPIFRLVPKFVEEIECGKRKENDMKFLVVEMSDGTHWAIPAMMIAKDRAAYHAKHDAESGHGEYDTIYEEEIVWAMSDDYEIQDWASNNMNWEDVSSQAVQLRGTLPEVDYHRDWISAPMSLQEMEL